MAIMLRRRNLPLFDTFRSEMDEVLSRFFENGPSDIVEPTKGWAPQVDIEETDTAMVVRADLPGVDAKDVEISIQGRNLTLKGEKHEEREEKAKQFHRIERFTGSFFRSILLPADADVERVTATANKGVFTVTVPKSPGNQPRKVMIKEKT